jgi:hypothetical protein
VEWRVVVDTRRRRATRAISALLLFVFSRGRVVLGVVLVVVSCEVKDEVVEEEAPEKSLPRARQRPASCGCS